MSGYTSQGINLDSLASPTAPTFLRASQHDPFERRLAGLPLRRASQHDRSKEAAVSSIALAGLNLFVFNRSGRGTDPVSK
jgi:hypothetical protein